jgi:leucyl aminopeptidase
MIVRPLVQPIAQVEAQWLVIGLFDEEPNLPQALAGTPLADLIAGLLASKDISAGVGDAAPLYAVAGVAAKAVLVVGLGRRARLGASAAFDAGVAAARRLSSKPRDSVAMLVPESDDIDRIASALAQGLIVGCQGPGLRKSEPARHEFGTLSLVLPPERESESAALERGLNTGAVIGRAINLARELVNLPPAEKPPAVLAGRARQVADEAGVAVEVWDETRIRGERFGGLLGVAAGSEQAPAFVVLTYRGAGDEAPVALVGKGVTFDSGGLSLKPSASMEDMKADMTGAAVVLATIQAAARLRIPINITAYMVLTENMTGGKAMKLGDVLTMRNGKTVEVLNTDAEGRLILADALSYAAESQPAAIVDLATLTGACVVALGNRVAGLFSNDDNLALQLNDAAQRTGERVWRMPLDDDYRDLLKSSVADLKNVGGKWAGAVTASKFLEQFVGETRWAHLDIAGPSWADSESATRDAGGTGCFVRTLLDWLDARSRGEGKN